MCSDCISCVPMANFGKSIKPLDLVNKDKDFINQDYSDSEVNIKDRQLVICVPVNRIKDCEMVCLNLKC